MSAWSFSRPRGLLDPVSWRNTKWMTVSKIRINGRRKCRAKNRTSVALLTANPPQTHWTRSVPR